MDLGIALLRIVVGALFIGHGTQKLFGWFGGHGIEGTGGFMETLGYRPGRLHAVLAGTAEALGGLLLVLGLWIPLGAAAVIGVMVNAIGAVHADNGLWVTENGYEYNLVLIMVAVALAFFYGGGEWGFIATAGGAAAGAATLMLRRTDAEDASADDDVALREDERQAA
jgi:putative oxidoreductase